MGAEFLARHYPVRTVLLPSPTWPSHNKIFPLAGVTDVRSYRYFKPSTRGLDYEVQPVKRPRACRPWQGSRRRLCWVCHCKSIVREHYLSR